jgi:L-threonylcarbamoyladenylate synthase
LNPWHINHAITVVRGGGVLAYPTEAVYGLGCAPYRLQAIKRILRLKHRKLGKGLILVGFHINQFQHMVDLGRLDNKAEILASWPGPVTWILPTKPGVPAWLTGENRGLAVRISAHPVIRTLSEKAGVLVSTSANPAGYKPAKDSTQVRHYFGNTIDFILPGTAGANRQPSAIRDAISGVSLRDPG